RGIAAGNASAGTTSSGPHRPTNSAVVSSAPVRSSARRRSDGTMILPSSYRDDGRIITSRAGSRTMLRAKPLAQLGRREESGFSIDGSAVAEQQQRWHAPHLVSLGKSRKSCCVEFAGLNAAQGLHHGRDHRLDLSTNDAVRGVDVEDRQLRGIEKNVELLLSADVGQQRQSELPPLAAFHAS